MLQAIAIGHLGGDAEVKQANGNEFTTFRIAHTEKWKDDAEQVHENTQWIDVTINKKPAVLEYLKKGQQVFVSGSASLRVYSSAKDRCMKAGLTINARQIELIGGRGDEVPSILFSANTGVQIDVRKYYQAAELVRGDGDPEWYPLISRSQERFVADRNGWIVKFQEEK